MIKKTEQITRKEFIQRTSRALIGAGIISRIPPEQFIHRRSLEKCKLGDTGINLTKLGFGASRSQEHLTVQLKKAAEKGIGIIAMKTCSGGPYSPAPLLTR